MNAAKCRVILKPSDLTPEQCALLREKLQAAVLWQQELAGKSPHVLQFDGELQESETAFIIAHEPAEAAWDAAALFDSKSPEIDDPKSLMRLAVALLDALKNAHAGPGSTLRAHGGMCPGVLLVSPDGIEKITDFGFAGAFCRAVGFEAYLNLAVGPSAKLAAAHHATGVWEVLSPDEDEREDRLCAFVDPEKYGTASFEGFEPGSDIIAAGFILHLIAEHRHPYLLEPESHRLVELAEMMSGWRYSGARRKDLRESTDPDILAWCGVVQKMLSRIPANRPTASDLVAELAKFVPRVDQGEILRRKVETAQALAEQGAWQECRSALSGIPDNESAPDDVREKASGLIQLADANLLLDRAVEMMKTDQWPQAKDSLEKVLALPALPKSVADRAQKASGVLEHNLGIRDRLAASQERIQSVTSDDPESARDLLQEVVDETKTLLADEATFPTLKETVQRLGEEAGKKLGSFQAELEQLEAQHREKEAQLEREREESRKQAQAWCDLLESALAEERWEELAGHLDDRPDIAAWPKSVDTRAGEIKAALAAHVAEAERKAAEEADAEAARAWIGPARETADSGAWDDVERLLAAKPKLRFFPEDVETQAQELHNSLADYRKREKDGLRAEEYVTQLKVLVDRESWVEAADLLGNRPALEFWPDAPLEDEALLKGEIEEHLEAIELQKRQIAAWMDSAETARNQKRFAEAIQSLQHPPLDKRQIPEDVLKHAAELIKQCQEALAEQRKRELETKTHAVKEAVAAFLKACLAKSLAELVQPAALEVKVGKPVFDTADAPSSGMISVDIGLGASAEGAKEKPISLAIQFEFDADTPHLLDESNQRDSLIKGVTQAVADRQIATFELVIGGLQKGVFPKAELIAQFDPPSADVDATLHLMGRESENGTLEAALRWDAKGMRWSFSDAAAVTGGVLREAANSIRAALPQRLLASVPDLKAYESRVAFDAVPGELGDVAQLPEVLPLRAQLLLKNDDGAIGSPIGEVALPLRKAGTIPEDFDARPLVVALNKKVVAAQSSARDDMLADLKRRASEADAKAKAWATPAKITEPTGTITFELGRKKKKPAARLSGNWQPDDFRYVLDEPYDGAITKLKDAAKSGTKKPGMALVAVLVVVLAGGAYFGSTLLVTPSPGTLVNQNTNANPGEDSGNGGDDPDDDLTTSTQKAESAAKRVLRGNCSLTSKPKVLNLVKSGVIEGSGDEASASLVCMVPGLAEPTIKLELELKGADWVLPDNEEERLKQAAHALCELAAIDDDDRGKVSAAELGKIGLTDLQEFLAADNLFFQFEAGVEPLWEKDADEEGWASKVVPGALRVGEDGKKLLDFPTSWRIRGGVLEGVPEGSDEDPGLDLQVRIVKRLRTLQAQSADELHAQLKGGGGDEKVGQLPDLTSLRTDLVLGVSASGLRPREFIANWGSRTLRFEPVELEGQTWSERANFIAAASAALAKVNERKEETVDGKITPGRRVMQEAMWLDVADGLLVEPKQSGSQWRLVVAAPWAKYGAEAIDALTVPSEQRLVLAVPVEELDQVDGQSLADLVAQSKPGYWPVVKAYTSIVLGDRFFARDDPYKASLGEALALQKGLPHCAVAMTWDGREPGVNVDPDSGFITEIAVSFDAKWSAAATVASLPLADLQASIESSQESSQVILTLDVDDKGKLTAKWDYAEFAEMRDALPRMRALDGVLEALPQRMKLESELLERFANGGAKAAAGKVGLDPEEALELLGEIRKIKGVPAPKEKDLVSLFESLNDAELFAVKQKVVPSLFVEYFCGPRFCFAVAGGLLKGSKVDAYAFKLCASGDLMTLKGDKLGNSLLGVLWKKFPDVLAPTSRSYPKLKDQFGVVLGLDTPMTMINLAQLSFSKEMVTYVDVKNSEYSHANKPFEHLSDFHGALAQLKCDFALVPYVGATEPWDPHETVGEKWAYERLYASVDHPLDP